MELCDITEIKEILARYGFHFSKSLGQNFLTAQWVPERIAAECGVTSEGCVLEIGPGMGCLTRELSKAAYKVVSLELDHDLLPVLDETLAGYDNIEVIQGDVLKTDIAALCAAKFGGRQAYACANLPYYITTPALSAMIDSGAFKTITVMVQKEVAQRICAVPGTAAYSAFSVYVNFHALPEILFDVPASCFVPRPKVDSAVIRLNMRAMPPAPVKDKKMFFAVVRAAFGQRRKTLANALGSAFGGQLDKNRILELITACGFDVRIRGERLSIEDFAQLANRASAELGG